MKVVLSTISTFHTFDLARQLHKRQVLEAIFTGYPLWKLKRENLPKSKIRTFPWVHPSYIACIRIGLKSHFIKRELLWWSFKTFGSHVAAHLPECDIYCGLSGSGLKGGRAARSRGAAYVCDRGSSHIRYQDRILRQEYERQGQSFPGIDSRVIDAEEAEYAEADRILVPSSFVRRSFVEQGVPESKLCLVPYGVDLSRFHPMARPCRDRFEVLFVGTASFRKGIPYLLQAFAQLEHPRKRLKLVGLTHPETEKIIRDFSSQGHNITHAGPVPQLHLKEIMSRSHVMILPSIEEGLALVQAQAMACGCPVIATTNTGAEDLFSDGKEGFIVPIRNAEAIADKLQRLADDPDLQQQLSNAAIARVRNISGWDSYGSAVYDLFTMLHSGTGKGAVS
jgi:starch synthase